MKQASAKSRVPNAGSWKPGQTGNANGRPRTGLAFAEAVRTRIDPNVVLDLVVRLMEDEKQPIAARLAAVLPYVHAGFVRPPTTIDAHVTNGASDANSFAHLSIERRRALLAELRAPLGGQPNGDPIQEPDKTHE